MRADPLRGLDSRGYQILLDYRERALAEDAKRGVPDHHGRRGPILPAQQFELAEQLADLLSGNHRPPLTVLDKDLRLARKHDEEAGGVSALIKEKMAAP